MDVPINLEVYQNEFINACRTRAFYTVRLFINDGIDVNTMNDKAMHVACNNTDLVMIKLLHDTGNFSNYDEYLNSVLLNNHHYPSLDFCACIVYFIDLGAQFNHNSQNMGIIIKSKPLLEKCVDQTNYLDFININYVFSEIYCNLDIDSALMLFGDKFDELNDNTITSILINFNSKYRDQYLDYFISVDPIKWSSLIIDKFFSNCRDTFYIDSRINLVNKLLSVGCSISLENLQTLFSNNIGFRKESFLINKIHKTFTLDPHVISEFIEFLENSNYENINEIKELLDDN